MLKIDSNNGHYLNLCPEIDKTDVVYISGSLIEGYGNSSSDVDIFVISDVEPIGENIIKKDKFTIDIRFEGKRRVDFEYWRPQYVDEIAQKLKKITPGKDFVAEKLSPVEELFIHRIKIGQVIQNKLDFEKLKNKFDLNLFSRYLLQQSIHRIDGAIEDLVGLLDDGDLDTAIFRAVSIVGLSVDAWCFYRGRTNPLEKWRVKKLSELTNPSDSFVSKKYFELSFPNPERLIDATKKTQYIEDCINISHEICHTIQQ